MSKASAKAADNAPVVVLDTKLVLSALVFASGRLASLRLAWQAGRCTPLVSQATAAELVRVLACPKFKLTAAEQHALLADCLPHCRTVRMARRIPKLPQCRDRNDQMFVELAAVGKADWLVTGDKGLLALAPQFRQRIVTADMFLTRLNLPP
jgi:uncharacterized protein